MEKSQGIVITARLCCRKHRRHCRCPKTLRLYKVIPDEGWQQLAVLLFTYCYYNTWLLKAGYTAVFLFYTNDVNCMAWCILVNCINLGSKTLPLHKTIPAITVSVYILQVTLSTSRHMQLFDIFTNC